MKYLSTRSPSTSISSSLETALFKGYAEDGGLYVPSTIPQITTAMLQSFHSMTFRELFFSVIKLFTSTEVSESDLKRIVNASFDTFAATDVIPMVEMKRSRGKTICELFHGPTYAFKDIGQQFLCKMLNHFAVKRKVRVSVIVSTTGDTGPAAIAGVEGTSSIGIFCFYPLGQVSDLQERQMTSKVRGGERKGGDLFRSTRSKGAGTTWTGR